MNAPLSDKQINLTKLPIVRAMKSPLADNEVVDIPFRWSERAFLQIHSCLVEDKLAKSLSMMYPATQVLNSGDQGQYAESLA